SQPRSAFAGELRLGLLVFLENHAALAEADPRPRVTNADARLMPVAHDRHHDLAALRELDGVSHEVRDDLANAPPVDVSPEAHSSLDAHVHRTLLDETGRLADDLTRERREVDARPGEFELPAFERRKLEDVVDEVVQMLPRPANLLHFFARSGR